VLHASQSALRGSNAPAPPQALGTPTAERMQQASSGGGLLAGAAMACVAVAAAQARRQRRNISRRALEVGMESKNGQKNYVNPWEQQVDADKDMDKDTKPIPTGWKFHKYGGPVYKKVPVVEGLEFPLDPKLYYPPLEPPAPGAKWGDGRSPDGNWYAEVDGEQVQYWQGWGRRKTACAVVRLFKGTGQFIINGRDAIEYFQNYPIWWLKACEPMAAMSIKNDYDCMVKAFGGGKSGQAGAIRLAVSRAMQEINFNWRPLLKKAKYLTRDWRMVEPKKTGQPKARKKKPYHKR
jgi:small subunit ribosomal protein S9